MSFTCPQAGELKNDSTKVNYSFDNISFYGIYNPVDYASGWRYKHRRGEAANITSLIIQLSFNRNNKSFPIKIAKQVSAQEIRREKKMRKKISLSSSCYSLIFFQQTLPLLHGINLSQVKINAEKFNFFYEQFFLRKNTPTNNSQFTCCILNSWLLWWPVLTLRALALGQPLALIGHSTLWIGQERQLNVQKRPTYV